MEENSIKNNHNKHHAIMFPLHLQGHINPFVQLALNLASKGFAITFLTFEHMHQKITQASSTTSSHDLFDAARQGSKHVNIKNHIISDGLPLDYDRSGKLEEYLEWYLQGEMFDNVEKGISKIVLESNPQVNLLIVDTFYPWASKIAKKFGLRFASFWTEPAIVFNLYYHVHLLRENGHYDCPDNRSDPIEYIPGVVSINPKDLMSYLQDKDTSTNMHKLIFQAYQDVRSADYVLCNTVQELEPNTIPALQTFLPFYPIGPILLSDSTKNAVHTSFWAESNCSEWLDSKSHGSVLYVSFGSLANFTKNHVMEIAYGLKNSNVDFIWVLRPCIVLDGSDADVLPVGFQEHVRGRGIIVPWTNQIGVLSHPAVGGFVTHCGWNSVLESVWCEVPMLCFPVFTDQFTNRRLVVDDWKIGVNLCNGNTIEMAEIAEQIKSFIMSQELRHDLEKNIVDVKNILKSAVEANGSSERYVNKFIDELSKSSKEC